MQFSPLLDNFNNLSYGAFLAASFFFLTAFSATLLHATVETIWFADDFWEFDEPDEYDGGLKEVSRDEAWLCT